jgi:hypothetical protein
MINSIVPRYLLKRWITAGEIPTEWYGARGPGSNKEQIEEEYNCKDNSGEKRNQ